MTNLKSIRLGQCDITYNSVALGYTAGGVVVSIQNDVQETMIDEYGTAPVKSHHKGTRIEVKAILSEYAYNLLSKVINGAVLSVSEDSMTIGDKGGRELTGALLKLHPTLVSGVLDDVEIYKAVLIGESKLPFKLEEATTFEVTWLAIIDESKTNGNLLARFGIVA